MKKNALSTSPSRRKSNFTDQYLQRLLELRHKREHVEFNRLLEKIIPELKSFLQRRLRLAILEESIPAGKYEVDALVNEVYVRAYKHLEAVPNEAHLYSWIFKNAEALLEELSIESDFDQTYFKNIAIFTQPILDEMEEEFSRDADGDLVMLEDIDDPSYPHYDYELKDAFVEDHEQELINAISKKVDQEGVERHYQYVLNRIPRHFRNLFDLSVIQGFNLEEIAYIKNLNSQDIEAYLDQVRRGIRLSFKNRYLNAKN